MPPSPDPRLAGDRVTVRLARPGEEGAVARFYRLNDVHLSAFESPKPRLFHLPGYWAREIPRRAKALLDEQSFRPFVFDERGSETGDAGTVIGSIGVSGIVRGAFHAATVGYSLAESVVGRGLMTESLGLVVDYAFEGLNVHRLMANHHPDNVRSARVLERLGFVREGYAKNYLFQNGRWVDHVLTAKTNPRWRTTRGHLYRDVGGAVLEVRPTKEA